MRHMRTNIIIHGLILIFNIQNVLSVIRLTHDHDYENNCFFNKNSNYNRRKNNDNRVAFVTDHANTNEILRLSLIQVARHIL